MTTAERVIEICKKRGIPVARLERACDFSNGYIRSLKKGTFPTDRAKKISEYLEIPVSELIGDEENKQVYYLDPETAELAQQMYEDPQMRSLFHMKKNMSPEKFKAHYQMMKELYKLEHPEDDFLDD